MAVCCHPLRMAHLIMMPRGHLIMMLGGHLSMMLGGHLSMMLGEHYVMMLGGQGIGLGPSALTDLAGSTDAMGTLMPPTEGDP